MYKINVKPAGIVLEIERTRPVTYHVTKSVKAPAGTTKLKGNGTSLRKAMEDLKNNTQLLKL